MTDTTLLDRIMRWLGLAREKAYRAWKWQDDEAILVSTHSNRAWTCTVQQLGDGTNERVDVIEINRETGTPVEAKLDEPETYKFSSSFRDMAARRNITPDDEAGR
jgi:hypothetical protein